MSDHDEINNLLTGSRHEAFMHESPTAKLSGLMTLTMERTRILSSLTWANRSTRQSWSLRTFEIESTLKSNLIRHGIYWAT